jgi:hypothetical protein
METKQRVYSTHMGNVRRALTDAGFVQDGPWEFSKGTEHGCLYADVKGRKNSTRVRMRHELKAEEGVPDYLKTNDVHAEQALVDLEKILNGGYAVEKQATPSISRTEHHEPKKSDPPKLVFDRKRDFGCVVHGISIAIDEGMKVAGGGYVRSRIIATPKDVTQALTESHGMDDYFAVLASGKSTYEETERAMMTVVPYLYGELKKRR